MFDTEKAKMIAVKLARWHKVQPLADSDPNNHEDTKLWSTMRKWMNSGEKLVNVLGTFFEWLGVLITLLWIVPASYEDPSTQATFAKSIDMEFLKQEVKTITVKRIYTWIENSSLSPSQLETLSSKLTSLNSPIVFSHNDLLYGNVIYSQNQGRKEIDVIF
jgi:ethanolamine kinase